jgi:hypothetical protein
VDGGVPARGGERETREDTEESTEGEGKNTKNKRKIIE